MRGYEGSQLLYSQITVPTGKWVSPSCRIVFVSALPGVTMERPKQMGHQYEVLYLGAEAGVHVRFNGPGDTADIAVRVLRRWRKSDDDPRLDLVEAPGGATGGA